MITQDLKDLKTTYHQAKWALLLRGLIGIAMGIFILRRPLESVAAFALVIAIWALVDGLVSIVHSFDLKGVAPYWWGMLLAGIAGVAFGIAALYFYPALSLSFVVMWTAVWLLAAGFFGVYVAFQERAADLPWGWTLTFGIIAIIGGVLVIRNPATSLAAIMGLLAWFGIISGIVMLVASGKMQGFEQDVKHAVPRPV